MNLSRKRRLVYPLECNLSDETNLEMVEELRERVESRGAPENRPFKCYQTTKAASDSLDYTLRLFNVAQYLDCNFFKISLY